MSVRALAEMVWSRSQGVAGALAGTSLGMSSVLVGLPVLFASVLTSVNRVE
jgi:hypothetical protein